MIGVTDRTGSSPSERGAIHSQLQIMEPVLPLLLCRRACLRGHKKGSLACSLE